MKKMSKILALLVALVMVVTSLVACKKAEEEQKSTKSSTSQNKSKEKKKAKSEEELVQAAAEGYMDCVVGLDLDAAKDFVVPDSDAEEKLGELDFASMFEGAEEFGLTSKDIDKILKELSKVMSYELGDIEVDDDTAEVEVTLSTISEDFDPTESMDEETILAMLGEKLGYDSVEEFAAAAENGDITEEDAMAYMGEVIVDVVVEALKNADLREEDSVLVLEKIDGEWLVVEDK